MWTERSMSNVSCAAARGKWIPYAWSQSACEVPGFVWAVNPTTGAFAGSGTMACCIRKYGDHCDEYSQDTTPGNCTACGGTWRSIFKFRRSGGWVQPAWVAAYEWTPRAMETMNTWVSMIRFGKVSQMWENVMQTLMAKS